MLGMRFELIVFLMWQILNLLRFSNYANRAHGPLERLELSSYCSLPALYHAYYVYTHMYALSYSGYIVGLSRFGRETARLWDEISANWITGPKYKPANRFDYGLHRQVCTTPKFIESLTLPIRLALKLHLKLKLQILRKTRSLYNPVACLKRRQICRILFISVRKPE